MPGLAIQRKLAVLIIISFILSSSGLALSLSQPLPASAVYAAPDLQVIGIDVVAGHYYYDNYENVHVCPDEPPTFRAYILNSGSADSGFFNIRWDGDGSLSALGGHQNITAGGGDEHDHIWSPVNPGWGNLAPGSHFLRFTADFDGRISESNETNNESFINFQVDNYGSSPCTPAPTPKPAPTPPPPPPPDTTAPGGTWINPNHGFVVTNDQLHFEAHAYDNEGGSGVNEVKFTALFAGQWHTACADFAPDPGTDIFKCDWNLGQIGVPEGPITVAFDVYDKGGYYILSPNGSRQGEVRRPSSAAPSPSPSQSPSAPSPSPTQNPPTAPQPAYNPPAPLWDALKPTSRNTDPNATCVYFPETKHNLCNGFLSFWNKFGGLAIFGLPLTEEFSQDGVTMQYFERARLEWRFSDRGTDPEHFDVKLGLVGNEVTLSRRSAPQAPFQPVQRNTDPNATCVYFPETQHNLCNGFLAYWNRYGGLAVYGMPISEEFSEINADNGKIYTVQYFERARFEWHPGEWPARYDVMLGRLPAGVLIEHDSPTTPRAIDGTPAIDLGVPSEPPATIEVRATAYCSGQIKGDFIPQPCSTVTLRVPSTGYTQTVQRSDHGGLTLDSVLRRFSPVFTFTDVPANQPAELEAQKGPTGPGIGVFSSVTCTKDVNTGNGRWFGIGNLLGGKGFWATYLNAWPKEDSCNSKSQ